MNVLEVDLSELNGYAMVSGPQRPQELEQQHLQLVVTVEMDRQFCTINMVNDDD